MASPCDKPVVLTLKLPEAVVRTLCEAYSRWWLENTTNMTEEELLSDLDDDFPLDDDSDNVGLIREQIRFSLKGMFPPALAPEKESVEVIEGSDPDFHYTLESCDYCGSTRVYESLGDWFCSSCDSLR